MLKPSNFKQIVRVVAYRSSHHPVVSQSSFKLFTSCRPSVSGLVGRRSLFSSSLRLSADDDSKLNRPEGIGGGPKKKAVGKGGPVTWVNFAATGFILVILYVGFEYAKAKKEAKMDKERKREIGKSKIGGSFDLIDQDGKPRTSADFYGKWVLLYFGFTHCPDICPDEMEKLAEVYDKLTELSKTSKSVTEPVPLFITVDPERDGVAEVAEYVKEFHPKFVGLTGSVDKVKEACKAFRVYFSAGPRTEDNDYIVDHTIIIYLLDPDGQFVDYYGQTKTAEDIKTSVMLQMSKHQNQNSKSLLSGLVS